MKLIKRPPNFNINSLLLLEFKDKRTTLVLIIVLWWFSSWSSVNFDPSAIVTSFLEIIIYFLLIFPIPYIILFWPGNVLVNLGMLDKVYQCYHFSDCGIYILTYWGLFVFLHYKLIRKHKIIYFLLLSFLLLITAHGCSERTSGIFT